MEPCAASIRVDSVHLHSERLLEVVCALIRPLHAKIQICFRLHSCHDAPLPVCLVEIQVTDKEQDFDGTPHVLRCLPGPLSAGALTM